MKTILLLFIALFIVLPQQQPRSRDAGESGPDEWFVAQRIAGGGVPQGALERAARTADLMEKAAMRAASSKALPQWIFSGPSNIGGRVLDIAVDPQLSNTLYVAAASGGVWVSRDAGKTFAPAWPSSYPQAIGALAISSTGVLFAGTGEASPGGNSLTYGGTGIYRSTDRGKNWQAMGLSSSSTIGRIVIDPENENRIFVAAAGSHYVPGGERGVYLSEDGGLKWKQVLKSANSTTGAVDLAIDSKNPNRVFAAMWDRIRKPDLRRYGGPGSGVYFTANGGASWKRVGNGLPPSSPAISRIGIAIAPDDSSRMYAIVVKADGTFGGLYRSDSSGASWSRMPDHVYIVRSQLNFGSWFGRVWVDPKDANHLFIAGVELNRSLDGGQTWKMYAEPHFDHHAMAWDTKVPGRVYLGNDGGIYRSDLNGERPWVFATKQPYTQFYTVDVAETDPIRIIGGNQDNGVVYSYPSTPRWRVIFGGDGQYCLINYKDPQFVYYCAAFGRCSLSTNGGIRRTLTMQNTTSTRFNFAAPLAFDPKDPSILYFGGNVLGRSTDGGLTWKAISKDLTGGPGASAYPYGTLTTIAVANSNRKVLYVGTDDGRIWSTQNLGASWTRAQDPDIPGHWVTRVAIDPRSANIAYATFSGYRSGVNKSYVIRTSDGGRTWDSITGNLPLAPVNDIIVAPPLLFVGTDLGVYTTTDTSVNWELAGAGLPRATVTDLRWHAPTRTLYAATFGRGIYKLKIP